MIVKHIKLIPVLIGRKLIHKSKALVLDFLSNLCLTPESTVQTKSLKSK